MNLPTLIIFGIIVVLLVLAAKYVMKHGTCDECGGSCGGGCSHCAHRAEELQNVPERFRLKK